MEVLELVNVVNGSTEVLPAPLSNRFTSPNGSVPVPNGSVEKNGSFLLSPPWMHGERERTGKRDIVRKKRRIKNI